MQIIRQPIYRKDLHQIAQKSFGNLVKAVVDIERNIMTLDAELHSDEEAMLISDGSNQKNIWGINLYPDLQGDEFIEFDSMINVRPGQKNLSRGVDDQTIKKKIIVVVQSLIKD